MMLTAKYTRIQGRDLAYRTQKPVGIFSLCWRSIRSGVFSEEDEALFVSTDNWFKENLPEPPFYKDDNPDGAITYFKVGSSSDMIKKLLPVIKILDKHKIAYDIVYTDYVGKVIYEDDFQVAVIED